MTGAGKTHTMLGDIYKTTTCEPGICSMAIDSMFEYLSKSSDSTPKLKISYLEIYNEQVKDLLVQRVTRNSTVGLMILEDPLVGVTVPDLSEHEVHSSAELLSLVLKGNEARTMAATKGNQFSSRSHAILQISIQSVNDKNGFNEMTKSKLSLVDLAGSERAGDPKGIRMMEGGKINRSLLALGNCINILSDKAKQGIGFVPYRDSKLTRLLKDSLGGNTKTVMIACICQMAIHHDETINTLKYAERAKKIEKKVVKNVREVDFGVDQYKEIIKDLRAEIASLKSQLCTRSSEIQMPTAQNMQVPMATGEPVEINPEEIEEIDEEIMKTKEIKNKIKDELIQCRNEDMQALDFYNSVLVEDDTYLNKVSHDLLTKYEEHCEIKESIQELSESNTKLQKNLDSLNKELDDLVQTKTETKRALVEREIERKLSEIEGIKKEMSHNDSVRTELEKSLDENTLMQQKYLSLVIKLQSQKKKDVLELQIATKTLRTEKVELALENLELKRQLKLTESNRSNENQEILKLRADLMAANEAIKQKDMIIQTISTQNAFQTKEIEQLKKIKDMYAEAVQKSSLGDLISPSKFDKNKENIEEEVKQNPDNNNQKSNSDGSSNEAKNKPPVPQGESLSKCPSFASFSTVRNINDISGISALEDFNICVNAIGDTKIDRKSPNPSPFSRNPFNVVNNIVSPPSQIIKNAYNQPLSQSKPESSQQSRRGSLVAPDSKTMYSKFSCKPRPIIAKNEAENAQKRNNSMNSARYGGFFSSVSENYGKTLNSFHLRSSVCGDLGDINKNSKENKDSNLRQRNNVMRGTKINSKKPELSARVLTAKNNFFQYFF